jgi:hypothetical protein
MAGLLGKPVGNNWNVRREMRIIRYTLIAALAVGAAAAQAQNFVYTGTKLGSSASVINTTQVASATNGTYIFTTGDFAYTTSGSSSSGTITLTNGSGSISGAFSGNYSVSGPGQSFGGVVNFTSGTGAYAGYTGGGTFTTNISNLGGLGDLSVLSVNASIVPEPASLGALAVGAVALLRRRNKKA